MTSQTFNPVSIASLAQLLGRNWWLFLLRGAAALAFAVLSLLWPGLSLFTLILFFGAYAVVDGPDGGELAAMTHRFWVHL